MVKYVPGDVIVECNPEVAVVSDRDRGKRCDYCFRLTKLSDQGLEGCP